MRARGVGFAETGEHPDEFGDPAVVVQSTDHAGACAATGIHGEVDVGVGSDLRQVGDHDDLRGAGQPGAGQQAHARALRRMRAALTEAKAE